MAALAGGDVGAAATVAPQRRRLGQEPDPVRQHRVAPAGRIAVEVVQPERVLRELLALEAEQVLEHAALAVVPGIEPRDHRVDAAGVGGRQLRHRPEIERPGRVAAPPREVGGEEAGERREIGPRVRDERVGDGEVAAQLPHLGLRPRRQRGERPLRPGAVGCRQAVAERQVIERAGAGPGGPAPSRRDRAPRSAPRHGRRAAAPSSTRMPSRSKGISRSRLTRTSPTSSGRAGSTSSRYWPGASGAKASRSGASSRRKPSDSTSSTSSSAVRAAKNRSSAGAPPSGSARCP